MDVANMTREKRAFFNVSYVGMLFGLPFLTWYFAISFIHYDAALVWPDAAFWSHLEPPTLVSVGLYLAWIGFQALLENVLPGRSVEGAPLQDGRRLDYRLNGLAAFVVTILAAAVGVGLGIVPGSFLYDHFGAIVSTANLVVLVGCLWLLVLGRRQASAEERQLNLLEAYTLADAGYPKALETAEQHGLRLPMLEGDS